MITGHEIKEIKSQLCANSCVLGEVTAVKQLKCHWSNSNCYVL